MWPARLTSQHNTGVLNQQLSQHERQDASVAVIIDFDASIDPAPEVNRIGRAVGAVDVKFHSAHRFDVIGKAAEIEDFRAVQMKGLSRNTFWKLQRQHSHSDQIRTVNPLETLRNYRHYSQ